MVDSVGEYGSSSMSDTSRRCRCYDSSLSLSNWLTSLMSSTSFSVLFGKKKVDDELFDCCWLVKMDSF